MSYEDNSEKSGDFLTDVVKSNPDGFNNNSGGGYNNGGNRNYNNNSGGGYNNGGGNRSYGNNNGGNRSYGNNNGGGYNGGGNRSFGGGNRNFGNNGGGNYRKDNKPQEIALYKPFVVTGNKDTPPEAVERMRTIIKELGGFGYTLRTGASEGPETILEAAIDRNELYVPWNGFNDKRSDFGSTSDVARGIAKMFHPAYDELKPVVQTILARNARMILGQRNNSPAMFIICWSGDGAESLKDRTAKTGNAGHVIAIANAMRIPVFNFFHQDAESRLKKYLELSNGETQQTQTTNTTNDPGF